MSAELKHCPFCGARPEAVREPVLTPKWTIVNDEWVQAQFLLSRSSSGLCDHPADRNRVNARSERK